MKGRFESKYKMNYTLENRKRESAKAREQHPDRIPVICERVCDSAVGDMKKCKFLLPHYLTVGQFLVHIRKRVQLSPEVALFVYVNDSVLPISLQMADIYAKHKDEDGFLYMKYSGEATFGCK
ncbi:putative Autophagy protein Atg8 ubiquitin like Ubiquitin like autophagy protein Apg12 [Trypanosoma vivax]|uniref:Autophagy-related protein n=1 Tax=Trypanosoma vivax (strain Y486) TaxID=1055687 RepID=G0TZ81_TRYVY|nr:putative microtubule-associated protein 1A/1B, light chain 3 [Trypanosoma vivax]KAH8613023.1 putative Autophagy protein Atg8 ubiquitin like Ubiquitin like autophagy protein Apg12 [Trypanosoma vivax]CCC49284.1 putative microtubule-associated protein 1A/1B, light chain 3 [Trypanosoma vivax Y486]